MYDKLYNPKYIFKFCYFEYISRLYNLGLISFLSPNFICLIHFGSLIFLGSI